PQRRPRSEIGPRAGGDGVGSEPAEPLHGQRLVALDAARIAGVEPDAVTHAQRAAHRDRIISAPAAPAAEGREAVVVVKADRAVLAAERDRRRQQPHPRALEGEVAYPRGRLPVAAVEV